MTGMIERDGLSRRGVLKGAGAAVLTPMLAAAASGYDPRATKFV